MNLCRICGEERSPLDFNVELSDKTSTNWTYRELIEHHTRVSIKINKLLPQNICEECRSHIDAFSDFSNKLQAVQDSFEIVDDSPEMKECLVEVKICSGFPETECSENSCYNFSTEEKEPKVYSNDDSLARFKSMVLQLNVQDSYKLPDGEIEESALDVFNLARWSDIIKSSQLGDKPAESFSNVISKCNQDTTFVCYLCDSPFKSFFIFLNHVMKDHPGMEHLKHSCLICNKIYYSLEQLHQHAKAQHMDGYVEVHQCLFCGEFQDSSMALQKHSASIHSELSEKKVRLKRSTGENVKSKTPNWPKRAKSERIRIKIEKVYEKTVSKNIDYESDFLENYEEKPPRARSRKEIKHTSSKRSNIHRKGLKSTAFASEINTFEQLFAEELDGTSKNSTSIHLNINESFRLPNGEIPDEHLIQIGDVMMWKDLLNCGICEIPFNNINDLIKHADEKHNTRSKLFNCKSCDGEFSALCESPLINHLVERHFLEHLKFCCLVCSKMFYDLPSLISHYKTHDGKFEVLVCLICGWYAKSLDDLKEHKAFHLTMEKTDNQLLCEKVLEKFNSGVENSIRNYSVAEFEKNPDGTVTEECEARFRIDWSFGKFECPVCAVGFLNPFELFVHQRLKHPKDVFKKIYSCNVCTDKKDYSNLFTFVNHATSKHLENAKFTCIVCSKVFWNYLALANHYKDVHPSFPCVFCCHCGKIFMNVTVASSHYKALNLLRTPEERKLLREGKILEETSHICHVCARSFKSRGTLLNHVKTHEILEQSDLLQCHICSKFYKNKYKLAQHMVCHEDLRSWKCKTCSQAFNYKKLLQRHIQAVHENERPFGCSFCEKRFNSKYDLTVHVRLHTGEFPYDCPVHDCESKYPAWSNLFKHCQSRHKLDIRSEGYKKLKATQKTQKNPEDYETD